MKSEIFRGRDSKIIVAFSSSFCFTDNTLRSQTYAKILDKQTGIIRYAEYNVRSDCDDDAHEQLHICLEEVRAHKQGAHFSQTIMLFIGCDLRGLTCEHSKLPYWQCSTVNMPQNTHHELANFVRDGVYSLPCACYNKCGQWIFFRQAHFAHNHNMQENWEAIGWHRAGKKRYFLCPACKVTWLDMTSSKVT